MVVRPTIVFGAPIWHHRGKNGRPVQAEKRLEILQNKALKIIMGAFRAVVTEVLEVEAGVAPIHIILDELQDRATYRGEGNEATAETRQIYEILITKLATKITYQRRKTIPTLIRRD